MSVAASTRARRPSTSTNWPFFVRHPVQLLHHARTHARKRLLDGLTRDGACTWT